MAPSFKTAAAFAALHLAASASAATVFHEFNITWVTANPDGAFERPVIGINGQWPIPRIEVDRGDRLVVKVNNHLGDQPTSLHFHGLFQQGTNHMDGPSGVTQCPIPPGSSMTYNFTVDQPGTYWYHSHTNAQYPDGLRGPFIVNDRRSPYRGQYDEERVLTLSDWYHDSMQTLIPKFLYKGNPTGAEPLPNAALINETQNMKIHVEPGKTYMFRVINIGAFSSHYLWIEGHTMQIIEVDGVYTKPATAEMLYLSAAQRVSFLLTTRNDTTANFPIVASMDKELFDNPPDDIQNNCTSWLSYDSEKNYPDPAPMHEFDAFDDMTLEPYDGMELLPEPDRVVQLDVKMDNLGDGANYAFFNDITYVSPKVPTLYTVLSSGNQATNPTVYGDYTHSVVLEKDEVVQIIVNNLDPGRHPFHLHGHEFQSIYRSEEEGGTFNPKNVTKDTFSKVPMRRDTLVVWPNGNIVLRFRASNPGVWFFHCHIEWHVVSGLLATFIEAPLEIQKKIKIPQDHLDNCKAAGVPTEGNAAGNTVNLLDLTGQPAPPRPLPAGFTARGIVAFVFSIIIGLLGVAVVVWYGLSEPVKSRDDEPSAGQDGNRGSGEAVRDDAGVGQSTQAAEASEVK